MDPRIAVVIPCLNEELTIAKVVGDFRRALPEAKVYVFDNLSTDRTAELAAAAGATVVRVKMRGKGQVVARMLEVVPADILLMVDGDDTYPADAARTLLEPVIAEQADMVVGTRLQTYGDGSFRPLHVMGNRLVRGLINTIFKSNLTDIMSGYRAFTAELARNVPVTSVGFEVETELTLQTLYQNFVIQEVPVKYGERPPGSQSKLRTFRDGFRVLWTVFNIARSAKPLTFFGLLGLIFLGGGVVAGVSAVTFDRVNSVPLLLVASALLILAFGSWGLGMLLHAMNVRLKEITSLMRKTGGAGRLRG